MFRFESTGTMTTCCMVFSLFLLIFLTDLSFSAKDIDANTIALWTFDEAKGNTAADLSKKGHNLKVEGKSKWVKDKFGNALWFDKGAFVAHNPGKAIVPQTVFGLPRKEGEYVSAFRQEAKGW